MDGEKGGGIEKPKMYSDDLNISTIVFVWKAFEGIPEWLCDKDVGRKTLGVKGYFDDG